MNPLNPIASIPSKRTSGLTALTNGVRAFFQSNGLTTNVTRMGWKQREIILTQGPGGANRVSFMASKIPSGGSSVGGVLSRGDQPTRSRESRPIATFHRTATVSVWAVDITDPSNEEAQEAAFLDLLEWTICAMHSAIDPVTGLSVGLGALPWENAPVVFTKPPTDIAFGLEGLIEFTHLEPLFFPTPAIAYPQASVQRGSNL